MQRFERSLETSAADAFARVFGGALTPLEMENALRREAGDKLQELPDGQLLSPNHFTVTLSSSDFQRFADNEATSPRVVSRHLDSYFYDQNWGVVGDVVVEFTSSQELHTGQYHLTSECNENVDARQLPRSLAHSTTPATNITPDSEAAVESTDGASGAAGKYTATLVDKITGTCLYTLHPGTTTVGRGDDVDFRIPDTGVSRHHATIEWNGAVATITDLNSTNGTAVNGVRVSQWQLSNGDEIILGHSHILITIK